MEIKRFKKILDNNNAIRLNEEYILFNDLELYSFNTDTSIKYNNLDELLRTNFGESTFESFINKTKDFYLQLDGGRGSNSSLGPMGGGFSHAGGGKGRDSWGEKKYPAAFNAIAGGRYTSYEKTLSNFERLYKNADVEYGITIDEQGYTTRHIKGGSTSVAIGGVKNEMVVHNHPNGGNFSDTDLISIASGREKGIVAVGKKTYTFTKTNKFKAKEFIKAVKKAQWPSKYDYNKGSDWWLKKNATIYGYKYTAK